jgi:hypothetical protein
VDDRRDGAPRLAELLDRAWTRHNLKGVATTVRQFPSEANRWTAVVHATVETDRGAFSGLGEASPETVAPALGARLVQVAETRAVGRALGWATNTAAAVAVGSAVDDGSGPVPPRPAESAQPVPEPAGGAAAADVPAWLRATETGRAASPPSAPSDRPGASPSAVTRGSRAFVTAQSLWKACGHRGVAAPEPDPGWDEARLQEYVGTWSAELKQAAASPAAPGGPTETKHA